MERSPSIRRGAAGIAAEADQRTQSLPRWIAATRSNSALRASSRPPPNFQRNSASSTRFFQAVHSCSAGTG